MGYHPQDLLGMRTIPLGQWIQDHPRRDAIPSCPRTCWGRAAPCRNSGSHLTQMSQDQLGTSSTPTEQGSPSPELSQDGQMGQHPMGTAPYGDRGPPPFPELSQDGWMGSTLW